MLPVPKSWESEGLWLCSFQSKLLLQLFKRFDVFLMYQNIIHSIKPKPCPQISLVLSFLYLVLPVWDFHEITHLLFFSILRNSFKCRFMRHTFKILKRPFVCLKEYMSHYVRYFWSLNKGSLLHTTLDWSLPRSHFLILNLKNICHMEMLDMRNSFTFEPRMYQSLFI